MTFQIVYSLGSTIIQHLIPSLIVSVAYTLISRRIANRLATSDEQQNQLELKQRKNNYMLVSNHAFRSASSKKLAQFTNENIIITIKLFR